MRAEVAEQLTKDREEAWVGDAVLALYVRRWILANDGKLDGEKFVRFTSNDFLRAFGQPTKVEAQIGQVYETDGLDVAFTWIEINLQPIFLQQERNYQHKIKHQKKRKG